MRAEGIACNNSKWNKSFVDSVEAVYDFTSIADSIEELTKIDSDEHDVANKLIF